METIKMTRLIAAALVLAFASGTAHAQYMAYPYYGNGNGPTVLMPNNSGATSGYPNGYQQPQQQPIFVQPAPGLHAKPGLVAYSAATISGWLLDVAFGQAPPGLASNRSTRYDCPDIYCA
jgi:hypothetical protein